MVASKGLLRGLIVADVLLTILAVVFTIVGESSLPEPLRRFEKARATAEEAGKDILVPMFAMVTVLGHIVAIIGLFMFWRPARFLVISFGFLGLVCTALGGPYIQTGLGAVLMDAANLLYGGIIALVYFSPLKELFDQSSMPPEQGLSQPSKAA